MTIEHEIESLIYLKKRSDIIRLLLIVSICALRDVIPDNRSIYNVHLRSNKGEFDNIIRILKRDKNKYGDQKSAFISTIILAITNFIYLSESDDIYEDFDQVSFLDVAISFAHSLIEDGDLQEYTVTNYFRLAVDQCFS